jgi:hypothetical protein
MYDEFISFIDIMCIKLDKIELVAMTVVARNLWLRQYYVGPLGGGGGGGGGGGRERGLTILTTLFGRLLSPFRNIQIHKSTSTRRKKEKQWFVISQKFLLKNL